MGRPNDEIAAIFDTMARVLAFKGKDPFRAVAYERAARSLRALAEDIATVAREGRLRDIPGVGHDLAEMIDEYLASGHIVRCECERRGLPDSLLHLMEIPGLGPKTLAALHERFNVTSADDLQRVLDDEQLAKVPGFGGKRIDNLRRGLKLWQAGRQRMPLGEALPLAEALVADIRRIRGVERCDIAGSLRRRRETIGDFDLLVAARDQAGALTAISKLPCVARVVALGPTRATLIIDPGIQVDVRALGHESYGSALLYFTGSKDHNIHLRGIAHERGLKINEYGVFSGKNRIEARDEADIYQLLDMAMIPPELREDRGEIEAAQTDSLPALVEPGDLRGDLHVHSDYSDGTSTIEELAGAAEALGYEYLAITDHSPSERIAHGLDVERVWQKLEEFERVREDRAARRPRLLFGAEVDIERDGSLDYPDEMLARFDVVVAAVHSAFRLPRERMTDRILAAVANPYVHIIGHPSGRLLGSREPIDFDLDRVVAACSRAGVALEINGAISRLDLTDTAARAAHEAGALLAIGSDAHNIQALSQIRLGLFQARRAWVEPRSVVNTWPWARLERWLRTRRTDTRRAHRAAKHGQKARPASRHASH